MFKLKFRSKHNYTIVSWQNLFRSEAPAKRIVGKRKTVAYDRERLASSIHKACMRSFGFCGEAELTAVRVCHDVEKWLNNKHEVTKADIKRHAAEALSYYNPRAAYCYLPIDTYAIKRNKYAFI